MSKPSISVVLVRPVVTALLGRTEQFYASTDLTKEMLEDDEARVTPAQFCVAWSEALRLSETRCLALRIAESISHGAFGIVEYLCRSAPTLKIALIQWCRYLGILDDAVVVGLIESEQTWRLRLLSESEAPAPASHELCFAIVAMQLKTLVSHDKVIARVHFQHDIPQEEQTHFQTFFGVPVQFSTEHTELVFRQGTLDLPLKSADPELLKILLPAAGQAIVSSQSTPTFVDSVRFALKQGFQNNRAQVNDIAQSLGMTGRSLQRRLKAEGTSFQAVHAQTRESLAMWYLGQDLSVGEISFLLGFSEPSAFFRAFKRWTGRTPRQKRNSLRA